MKLWDVITTIALVLACVLTPYGMAFDKSSETGSNDFFQCNEGTTCIETITDMIFIFEIFVAFNTSIVNPKTSNFSTNRGFIAF